MSVETAQPGNTRRAARPALWAGLAALVAGVFAQVWAHHTGVVFAFWDAQAHLDIARRVVDSVTPGLQMLGTVWLPVPHLLMLPFSQVDRWWWNGLAGGIVGLAAFITIIVCLHDLLLRRTRDWRLAAIGTAFVLFNPSLLYLQTTAMTEPVLLACLTGSVAALDRWADGRSRGALMAAGCLAALAVGSRYDGWFYMLLATPVVAWIARTRQPVGPPTWWRDVLTFVVPALLVVAAWLVYNWHFFGDPLEFQRGVWSAQSQQAARATQGQLPTAGRPDISLLYYLGASVLCAGAVLTAVGLVGAAFVARRLPSTGVALLLLSALPFNVLALATGQSVIQLPWTHPAGLLNLRYGVMMLPGLGAALTLALAAATRARPAARQGMLLAGSAFVALQLALFAVGWPSNAGALREGLAIRDGDIRQQRASDWLAQHYDGGRVLVDEVINISPRTRVALRDRVYRWTWKLGPAALAAPEREVDWVMVDRRHPEGAVAQAMSHRDAFPTRFDRAFDDDGLQIWRRR